MAAADLHTRFEYRGRDISFRVFKKVRSIRRLVGARYDQIEVTVPVVIHRQRPGPKPDSQINHQSRIVVFQRLKPVGSL